MRSIVLVVVAFLALAGAAAVGYEVRPYVEPGAPFKAWVDARAQCRAGAADFDIATRCFIMADLIHRRAVLAECERAWPNRTVWGAGDKVVPNPTKSSLLAFMTNDPAVKDTPPPPGFVADSPARTICLKWWASITGQT